METLKELNHFELVNIQGGDNITQWLFYKAGQAYAYWEKYCSKTPVGVW
ncbi:MAG: hypothetical protein RI995_354 [Bacteroidota bacterium]|jgi:hypothetical protein